MHACTAVDWLWGQSPLQIWTLITKLLRCGTPQKSGRHNTEVVPVERRSDENPFVFEVNMEGRSSLDFVICLHITNIDELEYWDNNNAKNYSLVLQ